MALAQTSWMSEGRERCMLWKQSRVGGVEAFQFWQLVGGNPDAVGDSVAVYQATGSRNCFVLNLLLFETKKVP
jgi:hypothetical protein